MDKQKKLWRSPQVQEDPKEGILKRELRYRLRMLEAEIKYYETHVNHNT